MPELRLFIGPMFGGKTTKLLSALERYQYQNKKTILFKPDIDSRYSSGNVVTHQGHGKESTRVKTGADIINNSSNVDIIAVDELFMIPGSAAAVLELFKKGKTILVSTLQLSSHPSPLIEVQEILPWATNIEICPAVCSECDSDAYYTRRLAISNKIVEVGGSESYTPLCYDHYHELRKD
jgi:thymidine kinase